MRHGQRVLTLLLFVVAASALAHDFSSGKIRIEHPWAAPADPDDHTAGIYLTLHNDGDETDTLLSASTTKGLADSVTMEEFSADKDQATWRDVRALGIEADATLVLEPTGKRLLLNGLRIALNGGTRFPVFLNFEQAGPVEVEVWVEGPESGESAEHHGH